MAWSRADRNLAMVFESYALYPQLNVFDNMAFPLRSPKFRMPEEKVRERVTHHAKVVRIGHLLQRPIQALSSGQRLRAALGRALVRQPDLFLLDEPLSHLDAKLRHSMRAELKEMRMHLGTTIYATHNCLEAMSLEIASQCLAKGAFCNYPLRTTSIFGLHRLMLPNCSAILKSTSLMRR